MSPIDLVRNPLDGLDLEVANCTSGGNGRLLGRSRRFSDHGSRCRHGARAQQRRVTNESEAAGDQHAINHDEATPTDEFRHIPIDPMDPRIGASVPD